MLARSFCVLVGIFRIRHVGWKTDDRITIAIQASSMVQRIHIYYRETVSTCVHSTRTSLLPYLPSLQKNRLAATTWFDRVPKRFIYVWKLSDMTLRGGASRSSWSTEQHWGSSNPIFKAHHDIPLPNFVHCARFNQQGPMISCCIRKCSKGLVLAPKMWLNVLPLCVVGNW